MSTSFIPVRDWSSKTGALIQKLRKEDTLVVTQNGQPAAYVIRANPATIEQDLQHLALLRLRQVTESIREDARRSGRRSLSMREIDAEIARARRARRARAVS
ncbi:MAG: hypothetical protein ACREIA_26945 [Opitutaceae bacterium]